MKKEWLAAVCVLALSGCILSEPESGPAKDAEDAETVQAPEAGTKGENKPEQNHDSTDEPAEAVTENGKALTDAGIQNTGNNAADNPEPDDPVRPQADQLAQDSAIVFPVNRSIQETGWYCGPAVMQMLLRHYGLEASQRDLAGQLHTSEKTGTEYADMARVASVYVFGKEPAQDADPGFRAWTGVENGMTDRDKEQFLARLKQDLNTGDVLSAAVDVAALTPQLSIHAAHVVLINGIRMDSQGQIREIRIEDPSYLVDYAQESDHWVETEHFLEAMNRCPEPGYIW